MKLMEKGNIRFKWAAKCEVRSRVRENAAFLLAKQMTKNRLPKEWIRGFGYHGWEAHANLEFARVDWKAAGDHTPSHKIRIIAV